MNHLPRIALGTVQDKEDVQLVLWALMNVLERAGLHVQSFASRSRCESRDVALCITGQGRRHLDSWLMQPDVCAELFSQGSRSADVGIVDGVFDSAKVPWATGGSLDTLCSWLDLPQVAVVNAALLQSCQLPSVPIGLDGIILDNVADSRQLCRVQTECEALYGVPVLGAMESIHRLRAAFLSLPRDAKPTPELCNALGSSLLAHFRFDDFLRIASKNGFAEVEGELFRHRGLARPLNVAVAHDEAFSCHFPDTLDVLESQGASVNVFSPLRSETLPAQTDLVYIGCGQLEKYAGELAANVCIKEALWNHVISGGRVYAESDGLAYCCREVVVPGHCHWSMAGLLPGLARCHPQPAPEQAVEVNTGRGSWLFPCSETVRGYLSSKWIIHPEGGLVPLVSEAEHSHDLVGNYQIVGSRLHLNFAARPDALDRFFQPCRRARLNTVS